MYEEIIANIGTLAAFSVFLFREQRRTKRMLKIFLVSYADRHNDFDLQTFLEKNC
jgi:hypothetical protein